jgi:photosystem II protein
MKKEHETRDVNARFVNGKPEAIESIYIMKSPEAWDRFMRYGKIRRQTV